MIELTSGKQPLTLQNPVMCAAGTIGFGGEYARLISLDKLGAVVTNPITYKARRAATGPRVVALDSGVLIHTGLPNPGIHRVIRDYAPAWKNSPTAVIVHLAATSPDELRKCVASLEGVAGVVALELGFEEDCTHRDIKLMVGAALEHSELPILTQLPLQNAAILASAAQDAGAGAVVISAPPRGTAKDPLTGQMVGGRVYGPWVKPLVLRAVGQVAGAVKIAVIGAGGIHNPDDARDLLEAGAQAVQLDAITWIRPAMTDIIARNLGGLEMTRVAGALADEWHPGLGETAAMRSQLIASPAPRAPEPPSNLPH
jgi:dihydroorotate dehydrogenase (NAD+) catalytic subunit